MSKTSSTPSRFMLPNLKRNAFEHSNSRFANQINPGSSPITRFSLPPISKPSMIEPVNRQSIANHSQNLFEQKIDPSEGVLQINHKLNQLVKQDERQSIKAKQQRDYSHKYTEKSLDGCIFVQQSKKIPSFVEQHFEARKERQIQNNRSGQNINFLQGFLPQIGFMYYAVEDTIFLCDAQHLQGSVYAMAQLNQQEHMAVYSLQCFTLKQPYFKAKQNVIIVLMPYGAELFEYKIETPCPPQKARRIKLTSINIKMPLPCQRHSQLVLAKDNRLYISDKEGNLIMINENFSFSGENIQLSLKKYGGSKKVQLQHSLKKVFVSNLAEFGKIVKNYMLSFITKIQMTSKLYIDDQRYLAVILVMPDPKLKQNTLGKQQHARVYDLRQKKLVYMLSSQQLQGFKQHQEITQIIKINAFLNNGFNFLILCKKGKRVFLDLTCEDLNKYIVYNASAIQGRLQNKKSANKQFIMPKSNYYQESCLIRLKPSDKEYGLLISKWQNQNTQQKISYIQLQEQQHQEYYLHGRDLQPISIEKLIILKNQASKAKICDLNDKIKQCFYQPQQLYFCSNSSYQRVIMLRPIDLFLTIFQCFHQNQQNLIKIIKNYIPFNCSTTFSFCELIAMITQILTDRKGIYYINADINQNIKQLYSFKPQKFYNRCKQLTFINYDLIERTLKDQLQNFMLSIAGRYQSSDSHQKQSNLAQGILLYLGRLLRTVWNRNINQITADPCSVIMQINSDLVLYISNIQKKIKADEKGPLGQITRWFQKARQLLFLVSSLPSLPEMPFCQALTADVSHFHSALFSFLTRQNSDQNYQNFAKIISFYANHQFTRFYKLWNQVKVIKESQKILEICGKYDQLPEYFTKYLMEIKQISQARIFMATYDTKSKQYKLASYQNKMEQFLNPKNDLDKKTTLLTQLKWLLDLDETKDKKHQLKKVQLNKFTILIKLQKMIVKSYQRSKQNNKSVLDKMFSAIGKQPEQMPALKNLKTKILQQHTLLSIIHTLEDPLLETVYYFYFAPERFEQNFITYIKKMIDQADSKQIHKNLQHQMSFLIVDSKLTLSDANRLRMVELYIDYLSRYQAVVSAMRGFKGQRSTQLYWPCAIAAQLGFKPTTLYDWIVKKIDLIQEKESNIWLYTSLCGYYFVKNYLPDKMQDFAFVLRINSLPASLNGLKSLFVK